MFDENRLRVFVAVAREGSVTAAAAKLHYAQPSVSHHLARLEEEIGAPLVSRLGRGIRLTEAGRLFAERAEEILGRIEAARSELASHAGLVNGHVRLAAFPTALAALVPAAAGAFAAAYPGVDVDLTEAEPPQAIAALRRGEVDICLAFHYGATPPGDWEALSVAPLFDEPMYLVTPPGSEPSGPRDALASYADRRWIAGCAQCRAHLLSACEASGFTPSVAFETDDYVAVQALVAQGMGVSTLPGLALWAHRDERVRLDLLPEDRRTVVALTYGVPVSAPARAFLDILETGAADTRRWPGSSLDIGS